MSVSSNGSAMSISFYGNEVSLEEAINDIYRESNRQLNDSQVNLWSLAMIPEQDNDFKKSVELSNKILGHIDELNNIFVELKSVVKQCTIKPESDDDKKWLVEYKAEKKEEKLKEKKDAKMAKALSKSMTIIDE